MQRMQTTHPISTFLLAFVLFFSTHLATAAPGDILNSFSINNVSGDGRVPSTPQGIVFHDGYLWVVDFGTDRIYRVYREQVLDEDGVTVLFNAGDSDFNIPIPDVDNPPINSDGNPIGSCFEQPVGTPQYCGGGDLTFAENFLWNASPITDDLIKLDPVDGDNLEAENALAGLAFPAPSGITFDGTFFWVIDWQTNTMTRVLPEDGSMLGTVNLPTTLPSWETDSTPGNHARAFGAAWDGEAIWVSERETDTIIRVRPSDGTLLNSFPSPGGEPNGLAWDGDTLWHVDRTNDTIYQLDSGVIPYGLIGCIEKNGVPIDGDVILSQTAIPDQATTTDVDGCFNFPTFESGVPMAVNVAESGLDAKPFITLNETSPGNTSVTLIVGQTYSEPGFVADDAEDGIITSSVVATPDVINNPNLIDTSVPGPVGGFSVDYNVIDSAGNAADTVTRTVYVLEVDTTPPVITLLGDNPVTVEQLGTYTEPGANAFDDRDGDISGSIVVTGAVDTSVAGSYTLNYDVSDSTGNAATTVTRTVNVVDTTLPTITLLGANPITHEKGDTFTDPGATANDNVEGDISGSITVSGSVAENSVGTYLLTYDVQDSSGNAATTVSRTINVIDTTAPVITLNGANPLNVELNTSYTEPGASVIDYSAENISAALNISGTVNTALAGSYTLTYSATDGAGNAATNVTRTVIVADTGAPSITVLGLNPITHEEGTSYTDPGATASDSIDGDLTGSIVVGGDTINASTPTGSYTITYDVNDSAGNPAPQATRTVVVSDNSIPVITLTGSPTVLHELQTPYTDAGATASDSVDGDLTSSIVVGGDIVDTSVTGIYTITYNVVDSSGNNAVQVTRQVNVADRTAPSISLVGLNPMNHEINTIFSDPGATATDGIDGDITSSIGVTGAVDASTIGSYVLSYNVSDAAGNSAPTVTRTVNVVDTGAPSIALIGANPILHELQTPFTDPGATASDASDGDLTSSIVVTGAVDPNVAGTYTLSYNVTDSQSNAATTVNRDVIVADRTAPIISLTGANPINHEQGTAFTDPGATATDIIDGALTPVATGTVDVNTAGTYTISYNISDAAGNAATTVTRDVIVRDTTIPVITLVGANPLDHEVDTVFVDPGATATDNIDGTITGSIGVTGTVDASTLGSYTLTYNVQDSSGNNATTVTRTVNVVDTGAPSIALIGANPILHELQTPFTDPGATASDAADGDLTSSIVVTGSVNVNTAATYTLNYDVTDSQGNPATTVARSVIVADRTAPVITLTGSNPINQEQGVAFTDPGATASDVIDGNVSASIVVTGSVNVNVPGSYTLSYNVSDAAGNAATTVTRTVIVGDATAPVITLIGANPLSHEVNTVYNDPGATALDNIDGDISGSIGVTGSVNANVVGSYTLTYNVSDSSGNAATTVTRTVNVQDTGAPIITITGANPLNHEINTVYTDPGATASDALDDDATLTASIVTVNNVNANAAGTYTVTYDVTDSSGNPAAQQVRTVNVNDFTAPVITLNGSATVNVEQGSSYTDAGATATDNVDGNLTSSIVQTGTVAPNTAGTYVISYNVSDAAGNAATQVNRTVIVSDTTPPTISLIGSNPINHEQGTAFTDPGAGATDTVDGDVSASIVVSGSVNVNAPGTYTLTYNVSDAAGNNATTVTRDVIVADTLAPSITLTGADPINHEQGATFTDPGTTASDLADGDLTASVVTTGSVNVNVAGTYTLTYNVSDAAGNAAPAVTRDVIVADTIAPVITLTGSDPVNHEQGTAYTDDGATANDSFDGDITGSVLVTGSVNVNTAGTYTLSYNVSDAAGNAATTVTRDVIVADTTIPVITLVGDATVDHPVGQIYVDDGATATDNIDGDITGSIVQGGAFDYNTVGTYVLTYDVSDAGGNAAVQVTRTVNVVSPTTVTNQLEAETVVGLATASAPETGWTGSGYVNLSGTGHVEYTFTSFGIPYDFSIRYASTELTAVDVEIILNSVSQGTISLTSTGGLSAWIDSSTLTLNPQSGSNTLRINVTGASSTALDSSSLTPQ